MAERKIERQRERELTTECDGHFMCQLRYTIVTKQALTYIAVKILYRYDHNQFK